MSQSSNAQEPDKRVIGLYGEMRLAMELHGRGWQVYRAYIDEKFDFVIMKTYCYACDAFTSPWKRETVVGGQKRTTVTNLCDGCHSDSLRMLVRFIQVKTSEGVDKQSPDEKVFSFHPKIRYHLADGRVFYAWIQVWDEDNVHFFLFHTNEVNRFDDVTLASYQTTDNQKTSLRITRDGKVLTQSKYDYSVFEEALDNFDLFDELRPDELNWKP